MTRRSDLTPEHVRASNQERYGVPWRTDAAELMRLIASHFETMARALDEDDDILGALAGMGLANHLPLLPKHIRDVLMENLALHGRDVPGASA